MMESYFSPSDNTAVGLVDAVRTADTDLEFALLTFTYNELGTAVRDMHDDNVSVRGIINNTGDQGSEYDWLLNKSNNQVMNTTVSWNFCKYILDEKGQLVNFFPSAVSPFDDAILEWLQN